jgi:toxin ParE1/3/4
MPRAERDLGDVYATIDALHSDAASRWFAGLERAVFTLEQSPARCPVTPENKNFRHLLYGKKPHVYRVVYRILERQKEVEILHIRHGAMDKFKPEELL